MRQVANRFCPRGYRARTLIRTAALVSAIALMSAQVHAGEKRVQFDIEAQRTDKALVQFAEVSGLQVMFSPQSVNRLRSPAIHGQHDPEDALKRLLDGTGLEYRYVSDDMVIVRPREVGRKSEIGGAVRLANLTELGGSAAVTQQVATDDAGARAGKEAPLEEIVTIGTRSKGRTVLSTPVPVDVFNESAMRATGATETGRILQAIAPSFNFSSSSVSDGTDALRPATLRGLGPDQTLVLINGKRRHTSALIHVNTSVGRGTAGVDMNAVTPISIKRIEILRDGAAALYGSDAIAGVINIVLKDQDEGGTAHVQYGQTYEGDGDTFVAAADAGFRIGPNGGFLNVAAEYRNRDHTNRAGLSAARQYPYVNEGEPECDVGSGAGCIFDPREFTFNRKNFRIGDPDSEQRAFSANGSIPFSETGEFYFFGTYSDRENTSAGFYRRVTQFNRTVVELYPDGFLPLINTDIEDYSLAGGLRWELDSGWNIDASVNAGGNSFNFFISNSLNASFGPSSPTSANAGTLKLQQTNFNLDIVKNVDWNGRDVTLAFGGEFRSEMYKIKPGEPVSYADGGAVNTNCPGCDVNPVPYAAGFQVFRGFSPANAVDESRNNYAFYADIESQLTDRFYLGLAGRFEDYSDFGSTATGKASARFELTPELALRGSISSGFRAPSMQQRFFNSVSTQFVEVNGETVAQERGTFRNDSPVARALGIPKLKEETSFNLAGGFVATPLDNLTLTVDYYRITINDRIVITGSFSDSNPIIAQLLAGTGASAAQFFTNAVDTRTQGVDAILTYDVSLGDKGDLKISAAGNWTETKITGDVATPDLLAGFENTIFTAQDRSIIEDWQPKSRINLTGNYLYGPFDIALILNRYGSYTVCEGSCDTPSGAGQNVQKFSAKILTDVQVNYHLGNSGLILTAGVNNLFDVTPDKNLIGQSRGGVLPGIVESPGVFKFSRRSAPFGFNGGLYYARVTYNF